MVLLYSHLVSVGYGRGRFARCEGKGRHTARIARGPRDHIIIRKTEDGVLLVPGEKEDFVAEFMKTVEAGPRRTGRPTNPAPAKMKSIWNEGR